MRAGAKKQFAKRRGGGGVGRLCVRGAEEEWPEWNGGLKGHRDCRICQTVELGLVLGARMVFRWVRSPESSKGLSSKSAMRWRYCRVQTLWQQKFYSMSLCLIELMTKLYRGQLYGKKILLVLQWRIPQKPSMMRGKEMSHLNNIQRVL